MQKILFTLFTSCLLFTQLSALIIEAPNLNRFEETLETIDQQSLVLFDVDETLLIPKDLILNPYAREAWNEYAKETIENPEIVPPGKYDDAYFFGQVLSKIEYKVVDPKVVGIVRSLQRRNIKTIAFTRMPVGPLGVIPSMEDWRIGHLKKHQFDFSPAFPQFPEIKINVLSTGISSLFKQGMLCANKQDKGPVFTAFLDAIQWKPLHVVFIDNRLDYLKSVEIALEGTGIEFIGFHYRDVENRPRVVNEQLAKFQLRHLAETGEWLSDEEALFIEHGLYSINEVLDAVSENYRPSINQAISFIASKEAVNKIQFKPLLGGLTKSKVFRVDIENKKYVLRLLDENQPLEKRRSELNAHKIAAGCKIAPEIIYADQTLLVVLMEYIEGRTLTKDDLNNSEIVKKIMCALKKFHQHPKERDLIRRTKVEAIQDLYDRYKNKKGVVFPSCFDQLHSELKNDFAELKTEHMPSHGDFNPRNILIAENGHIYIIDWAQASIDHPFLDIGWLATFSAANNEQVRALLREYLEREPKESELKEALFFKDVTAFLVATLWIGRQEERNQIKLDSILEGSLKKGPAYIMEDISVEDILKEKKMSLTLYSLGWLKEFIDSRTETTQL